MEGLEGIIYLAIIAFMFGGGFGNFGFGGANAAMAGNLATQNDVQRGFDYTNLQNQTRDILSAVNGTAANTVNAVNQAKCDNINVAKDIEALILGQIGEVKASAQQAIANNSQCCCDIKQLIQTTSAQTNANIAEAKYENAMNLAGLEQRLTSKIDQNKIEALQAQVQQLQLQQAMCGVVRYPLASAWNAGPYPPTVTTTTG